MILRPNNKVNTEINAEVINKAEKVSIELYLNYSEKNGKSLVIKHFELYKINATVLG